MICWVSTSSALLVSGEQGFQLLLATKEKLRHSRSSYDSEADDDSSGPPKSTISVPLTYGPDANYHYVLLVNRGGMYFHAGQLDRAIADLEAAIQLNDKPYNAYSDLFQIYQRQGRLDLAAAALDRALERQPDRPELRCSALPAPCHLVARPQEGNKERGNKACRPET